MICLGRVERWDGDCNVGENGKERKFEKGIHVKLTKSLICHL